MRESSPFTYADALEDAIAIREVVLKQLRGKQSPVPFALVRRTHDEAGSPLATPKRVLVMADRQAAVGAQHETLFEQVKGSLRRHRERAVVLVRFGYRHGHQTPHRVVMERECPDRGRREWTAAIRNSNGQVELGAFVERRPDCAREATGRPKGLSLPN
ncbi:MAG: hypothetical protein OXU20_00775 [Myxococcales bacterium]|nr:hypothetical protein [Myxococcales bacterium]MDD9967374.1 hypothetical protein [Myxococcales bacterium]